MMKNPESLINMMRTIYLMIMKRKKRIIQMSFEPEMINDQEPWSPRVELLGSARLLVPVVLDIVEQL